MSEGSSLVPGGPGPRGAGGRMAAIKGSPPMSPEELKEWRERKQLTQETLAEILGVHRVTVAKWEAGTRGIPPFLHLALAFVHITYGKEPGPGEQPDPEPKTKGGIMIPSAGEMRARAYTHNEPDLEPSG